MQVKLLNELNNIGEESWNEFLNRNPKSSIYHTLEWKKILEETYCTLKDRYLVVVDENNNNKNHIIGAMPLFKIKSRLFGNRISSLPLSNYSEILYDNEEARKLLIEHAIRLSKEEGCKFLEIREKKLFEKELKDNLNLKEVDKYLTIIIPLSENPDDVWLNMNKARRKSIKKAKKQGVTVRESKSIEDLKKHYKILIDIRKDQGVPTYGFKFFKNIHKHFFEKGYSKLYIAEKDNEVLFSLVAFFYKKTVTAGYGMARKGKKFSGYHASELAYWNCFEWACKNGFTEFDFGRCNKNQESLIDYKQRWGGNLVDTPYYYSMNKEGAAPGIHHSSGKFSIMKTIWKKIPIPITEYIGPKLFKHLI